MRSKLALHAQAINTGITSDAVLSAAEMVRPMGLMGQRANRYLKKVSKAIRPAPIAKKTMRLGSGALGVRIIVRVEP